MGFLSRQENGKSAGVLLRIGLVVACVGLGTWGACRRKDDSQPAVEVAGKNPPAPHKPPVVAKSAPRTPQKGDRLAEVPVGELGAALGKIHSYDQIEDVKGLAKNIGFMAARWRELWDALGGAAAGDNLVTMRKACVQTAITLEPDAVWDLVFNSDPGRMREEYLKVAVANAPTSIVLKMIDDLTAAADPNDRHGDQHFVTPLSRFGSGKLEELITSGKIQSRLFDVDAFLGVGEALWHENADVAAWWKNTKMTADQRQSAMSWYFQEATNKEENIPATLDTLKKLESTMSDDDKKRLVPKVFQAYAGKSTSEALAAAAKMTGEVAQRAAADTVVESWLHWDSIAASNAVANLPEGIVRQAAVEDVVHFSIQANDFDSARKWIAHLTNKERQQAWLKRLDELK